ncbi:MAG TPA: arginase family protein [Candidatus Acidoferrum sp.]
MAVKIVRQPKKIALIGAPSSAAAFQPGSEKAPAALRAAGLVDRLKSAGFEVHDYGDCAPRLFADDDEHRRARNLPAIVAGLNDLKVHAEVAMKSGALVLVLGGDCVQSIGLLTGARRYYKHLNLIWFDRDADLNTPATTPSGRIDGMVVAHIIGRGAPELVRFWGETPLVREPDVLLYGITRLDPPEQEVLAKSPLRHVTAEQITAAGARKAASDALAHSHADTREFILHIDLDVIGQDELSAVNVPSAGGLNLEAVRESLEQFVSHKNLLGLDVAQFNPDKDPDGSAAKKIVDLLVEALTARFEAAAAPDQSTSEPAASPAASSRPAAPTRPSPEAHDSAAEPSASSESESAAGPNESSAATESSDAPPPDHAEDDTEPDSAHTADAN